MRIDRLPPVRRIVILVLSQALVLSCGGGGDGGDAGGGASADAGPSPEELWSALEDCQLPGAYRVGSVEGSSCEEWPREGETVRIEQDGQAPVLRAGALAIPITAERGECVFAAVGCLESDEDGGRYLQPEIELSRRGELLALSAAAVDVESGRVGPCGAVSIEAAPIGECDPVGSYEATADAPIATGSCDLEWPGGTVTIREGEVGYAVDWGGTEIDELTLDEASCSLSGSRGGKSGELWLHNGALRTVSVSLIVDGDVIEGTAEDALDGETFDGAVCPGATFELRAERPMSRAGERIPDMCTQPKPPACGDGVCEDGEGCRCEDCACTGSDECAPDRVCRATCRIETEAEDCGPGMRCSPMNPFAHPTAIFPSDDLYCETEGPGMAGASCTSTSECAAGLICHVPWRLTSGRCAPPCGEGFPACTGENVVCAQQGDGSGSGWYPTAVKGCEEQAGLAEDCSERACASGLSCLESCVNNVCEEYCTHSCAFQSCPPELPVCDPGLDVCMKP